MTDENIRLLTQGDLPRLQKFWIERWGSDLMITRGETVRYSDVEGFIYGEWLGLLTFLVRGDECEITSLDSLAENQGIGTKLMQSMTAEAGARRIKRLFLITTNDNLRALGFYQKRGFELCSLHRGAINQARKLKPSIPLIGEHGIPLRDELELELHLT